VTAFPVEGKISALTLEGTDEKGKGVAVPIAPTLVRITRLERCESRVAAFEDDSPVRDIADAMAKHLLGN
jgi:hypothetical protein